MPIDRPWLYFVTEKGRSMKSESEGDDGRGIFWAEWLLIEINLLAEGERWKSMLFNFKLDLKLATVAQVWWKMITAARRPLVGLRGSHCWPVQRAAA